MKHVKKSLLILTCLIFILSLNGCKKNKQQTTNTRKAEVLTPKAPGDEVLDYGEAVVDISNVPQRYSLHGHGKLCAAASAFLNGQGHE